MPEHHNSNQINAKQDDLNNDSKEKDQNVRHQSNKIVTNQNSEINNNEASDQVNMQPQLNQ